MQHNIRFGTYNILVPRPEKDEKQHKWIDRKEQVINNVVNHADIVGLQEFDTNPDYTQSSYTVEQLFASGWDGYLPEFDLSLSFEDVFYHRLPIFWRKNLFSKVTSGVFQISGHTLTEEHITPIVENRYCSWVHLKDNRDNSEFVVLNLHKQHHTVNASVVERNMAFRKQQESLQNLENFLSKVTHPVVLLGDFNNTVIPDWFKTSTNLLDVVADSEKAELVDVKFDTFHNWEEPSPQNGSHIDHILVSTESIDLRKVSVILEDGSDHFMLTAELAIKERGNL